VAHGKFFGRLLTVTVRSGPAGLELVTSTSPMACAHRDLHTTIHACHKSPADVTAYVRAYAFTISRLVSRSVNVAGDVILPIALTGKPRPSGLAYLREYLERAPSSSSLMVCRGAAPCLHLAGDAEGDFRPSLWLWPPCVDKGRRVDSATYRGLRLLLAPDIQNLRVP